MEEFATAPLAGGIMQYGYQCGMIWGASLSAGAEAYKRYGAGPASEAKTIDAARRLVDAFRRENEHINCLEITDIDRTSTALQKLVYFLLKGGTVGCMKMAAKFAKLAYREIESSFEQESTDSLEGPVSCASIVARKMGATDEQATMAAGFAGGIGLCGGACGALGAAVWMKALMSSQENEGKVDFKDPRAQEIIERFIEATDCEFECSKIVRRQFRSVDEHAAYLRGGGCKTLIDVLASEQSSVGQVPPFAVRH